MLFFSRFFARIAHFFGPHTPPTIKLDIIHVQDISLMGTLFTFLRRTNLSCIVQFLYPWPDKKLLASATVVI